MTLIVAEAGKEEPLVEWLTPCARDQAWPGPLGRQTITLDLTRLCGVLIEYLLNMARSDSSDVLAGCELCCGICEFENSTQVAVNEEVGGLELGKGQRLDQLVNRSVDPCCFDSALEYARKREIVAPGWQLCHVHPLEFAIAPSSSWPLGPECAK